MYTGVFSLNNQNLLTALRMQFQSSAHVSTSNQDGIFQYYFNCSFLEETVFSVVKVVQTFCFSDLHDCAPPKTSNASEDVCKFSSLKSAQCKGPFTMNELHSQWCFRKNVAGYLVSFRELETFSRF